MEYWVAPIPSVIMEKHDEITTLNRDDAATFVTEEKGEKNLGTSDEVFVTSAEEVRAEQ